MPGNGVPYASGNWIVTQGRESDFVARWEEFLEWTKAEAPGFRWASLIREGEDPRHFVSFAEWDSVDALRAWRGLPAFAEKLGACRALCDEFRGADYEQAARVG